MTIAFHFVIIAQRPPEVWCPPLASIYARIFLLLSHFPRDFEVVRFSVHYYYPISLEGKWDFEVVRFSVHYYYPISLEGKWDFEVVRFSVHYYYYYTCS